MSNKTTPPLRGTPPAEGNDSPSPKGWQAKPDGVVPKLRFPAFRDVGEWSFSSLGRLFSERQESGFTKLPLLSLMDKEGIVHQEETNRKNNSSADKSKYLRVVPGDIAYNTMRMWEGRSAYVGIEGVISPAYTVCVPAVKISGIFFSYYFKTESLIGQFRRYSQGLVKDTLNLKFEAFSRIEIPYPEKEREQQKIADCLASLDERITLEAQKLDTLKTHKKWLMQQLFPAEGETLPKLRFPEFRDGPDWESGQLGAVCDSISSGKDKSDPDGECDLYGSTGVIGKTSSDTYNGEFLLAARVGANAGLLTRANGRFGVTDNTLVIILNKKASIDFVFYYLVNMRLNKLVFGSGQPLITGGQLKALSLFIPHYLEQQKIADCLSSLDDLITAQTQKLTALKTHKKGLMQQLFPSVGGVPEGQGGSPPLEGWQAKPDGVVK